MMYVTLLHWRMHCEQYRDIGLARGVVDSSETWLIMILGLIPQD